jgi:uncharacterized 2Fe-2S/4Fe-4S cluster protein (DUF4445 family)
MLGDGKSFMTHLFLGLPVRQLAVAPHVVATDVPVEARARCLGLEMAPGAYVYVPPSIGGYVGADHVQLITFLGFNRKFPRPMLFPG